MLSVRMCNLLCRNPKQVEIAYSVTLEVEVKHICRLFGNDGFLYKDHMISLLKVGKR